MTTIFRSMLIFEIIQDGKVKTDAILDIPHRMSLEQFKDITDVARQLCPCRTERFAPGEYVDEVV